MAFVQKITMEVFPEADLWLVIEGKEYWAPMYELEEKDPELHRSYLEKYGEFMAAVKDMAAFIAKHPCAPTP